MLAYDRMIVFGGHRYQGDSKFIYFNETLVLELDSLTWRKVKTGGETILPRYGHSAELVGSRMFVFGGKGDENNLFRDMYFLDLVDWIWAPVISQSKGPSPRMGHASLLVGRMIVIHGGWDGKANVNNDIWIFNTETFTWAEPKTSGMPPSPRFGHSLNLQQDDGDGRIILFGGSTMKPDGVPDYLNDMLELNTESMVWSRVKQQGQFPTQRYNHTTSVVGSKMVLFGGWGYGGNQSKIENNRPVTETMEIFDFRTNTWYIPDVLKGPILHRHGHTCSIADDALVIFGGWDGKQATNDTIVLQL